MFPKVSHGGAKRRPWQARLRPSTAGTFPAKPASHPSPRQHLKVVAVLGTLHDRSPPAYLDFAPSRSWTLAGCTTTANSIPTLRRLCIAASSRSGCDDRRAGSGISAVGHVQSLVPGRKEASARRQVVGDQSEQPARSTYKMPLITSCRSTVRGRPPGQEC